VEEIAVFGYSQGGGATFVLAGQIAANPATTGKLKFTAYFDAVEHDWWDPDLRRPAGSAYHVNYYQVIGGGGIWLHGGPTPGPAATTFNLDVGITTWGAGFDHLNMDTLPNVINRIWKGSTVAGPTGKEGPHSGLTTTVTR
jgi:hypothetical protein